MPIVFILKEFIIVLLFKQSLKNPATLVRRGLILGEILVLHVFTIKSLNMNILIEERKIEAKQATVQDNKKKATMEPFFEKAVSCPFC